MSQLKEAHFGCQAVKSSFGWSISSSGLVIFVFSSWINQEHPSNGQFDHLASGKGLQGKQTTTHLLTFLNKTYSCRFD